MDANLPPNIQPGSLRTITDSKLVTFAVGQQKKTRFQKLRDEKEQKKRQDEKDAAQVYDSFVASFTEDDDVKHFVRGGVLQSDGLGIKAGEIYTMDRRDDFQKSSSSNGNSVELQESRAFDKRVSNFSSEPVTKSKGHRQIDDFLNEIKSRQDGKESHEENSWAPAEKGSFDTGDPTTTNIYLGNLSPTTTEQDIMDLFGRYGAINSVKIMWPFSEEERSRNRNCGFVSFKKRVDAEDAMLELQDHELHEFVLALSWGKPVKISSEPFQLPLSSAAIAQLSFKAVASATSPPAPAKQPFLPPSSGFGPPPMSSFAPPPAFQSSGFTPQFQQQPVQQQPPMPPPHCQQHQQPQQSYMPPGVPGVFGAPPFAGQSSFGMAPPRPPPSLQYTQLNHTVPQNHPHMPVFTPPPSSGPPGFVAKPPPPAPPAAPSVAQAATPAVTEDLASMSVESLMATIANARKQLEQKTAALNAPPAPVPMPASLPIPRHHVEAPAQPTKPTVPANISAILQKLAPPSLPPMTPSGISKLAPAPVPAPVFVPFASPLGQPHFMPQPILLHPGMQQHMQPQVQLAPPPPVWEFSAPPRQILSQNLDGQREKVRFPRDAKLRALIDSTARAVAAGGQSAENAIKLESGGKEEYAFLTDLSDERLYYIWRTHAYMLGFGEDDWSDQPMHLNSPGLPIIIPPSKHTFQEPDSDNRRAGREWKRSRRSRSRSNDRDDDRQYRRSHSRSRSRSHSRSRSRSPELGSGGKRRRSRSRSHSNDRDGGDPWGGAHWRDNNRDNRDNRDRYSGGGERDGRDRSRREPRRGRDVLTEAERVRYSGMTGAQIERARTKHKQEELARLSRDDYQEWKAVLSELTVSRSSIKAAMGFAYDKIESSEEIVNMIKDKLIVPSTHAAVKIAGLYLLSDILHNSGAPIKHAASYRSHIQSALPEVFEDLSSFFRHTQGRMSAFQIEDRVKKLLGAWADWSIFPALFLVGLQAVFYFSEHDHSALAQHLQVALSTDGVTVGSAEEMDGLRRRARAAGIAHSDATSKAELEFKLDLVDRYSRHILTGESGATARIEVESSSGTKLSYLEQLNSFAEREDASSAATEDIDGLPLYTHLSSFQQDAQQAQRDEDIDGVPIEDIDGMPLDDIDGVPLEDIDGMPLDDIDGAPLDKDIDGAPLDGDVQQQYSSSVYDDDIDGVPME